MNLKSIKNMKSNLKYWNPRNTRYGWISFSEKCSCNRQLQKTDNSFVYFKVLSLPHNVVLI